MKRRNYKHEVICKKEETQKARKLIQRRAGRNKKEMHTFQVNEAPYSWPIYTEIHTYI